MTNYFLHLLLFAFILSGCSKTNPITYKTYISGYWEIDNVVTTNGEKKEYKYNPSIDFYEINDTTGIKKRVYPKLDGRASTTSKGELFSIKVSNDSLRLHYKTAFSEWVETVICAKENRLKIKNKDGNVYIYRRYKKINYNE